METRKRWIDSACSCAILQEKNGDRARGFWQRARKSGPAGLGIAKLVHFCLCVPLLRSDSESYVIMIHKQTQMHTHFGDYAACNACMHPDIDQLVV